MTMVMMTLRCEGEAPTLETLRERFSLAETEIDESFGVVEVDPKEHIYTFLVTQEVAEKIDPGADWVVEGPYSNPRIEPFGPPRPTGEGDD